MNVINKIKRKAKYLYYDILYIRACKKVSEYYYYDLDKYRYWLTRRRDYARKRIMYEF